MEFWIITIIFLIFLEAISINLVSIWFVISGIVALILSFFIDSFIIQFSVFVILGIILLITTKPVLKKYINVSKEKTNLDRVVGMKGVVTLDIKPLSVGEVKVDGKRWSAISDKEIKEGEIIEVLKIEGVKLIVKKEEE